MIYTYITQVNIQQLESEISSSDITVALRDIISEGSDIKISFKADLSPDEKILLDTIVDNHQPIVDEFDDLSVKLSSANTNEGIPIVYATSKPIDHYVCFQGVDDFGHTLTFYLDSKTEKIHKDFIFDSDVYLKDGYIIVKGAPFGASMDVDIIHPSYNTVIRSFCKKIPISGTGWFPLNTEDRAFLPKGMIVRITIFNSRGGRDQNSDPDENAPTDFYVAGRLEIYRKMGN